MLALLVFVGVECFVFIFFGRRLENSAWSQDLGFLVNKACFGGLGACKV